ncbi:hypothetical protein TNCV_1098081 [Trichonephila clavipes]|nr:hypothetical protein TNCV_1098081 [Trichonephila clavipes]
MVMQRQIYGRKIPAIWKIISALLEVDVSITDLVEQYATLTSLKVAILVFTKTPDLSASESANDVLNNLKALRKRRFSRHAVIAVGISKMLC